MKRILVGGDTSTANSGFAVYKRHVLQGLIQSGMFQVAEVGYGGTIEDRNRVPWAYYPTAVLPTDPRFNEYKNNPANEYGVWRWESIVNNFRATHIFGADDPWQCAHTIMSPLRPYYSIIYSPTVDSIPQRQDFLQLFAQVDSLYTYTDWAANYLNECGLACKGSIGMGIDPDVMKPLDKSMLRRKYRLPEDAIIFGFVARNQLRKRFPELMRAFSLFLKKAPPEIAARSYLYLHTSSPDAGWNLATHLLSEDVAHKVLFTYMCRKTGEIFITTYKEDRTYSPFSGELTAFLPNVVFSPTPEKLNEVYNLMDCYVQCSNCFAGDTPVFTIEGWRDIKDIKVGDFVYTNKRRFKRVTNLFASKPKKILKILTYGNIKPLMVTENHPIFAYTNKTVNARRSVRETIGNLLRNNKKLPASEVIEAGSLQPGDMLVLPSELQACQIPSIDLQDYALDKDIVCEDCVIGVNKRQYVRNINIDKDFCRFVGLFAADGYASKKMADVYITSNIKDKKNIQLTQEVFKQLGDCNIITRPYKRRNAIDVSIYSKRHAKMFRELFYTSSQDKKLPDWYESLSIDLQKEVLIGLLMGDGCYSTKNNVTVNVFCTTSPVLAEQVHHLLINNGITFNCCIVNKSGNRKPQYHFEINTANLEIDECNKKRKGTKNILVGDNYLLQIKSIEEVDYDEYTYTLEVEDDHTYTTSYGFVNNCEGFGAVTLEAAASNIYTIGTDYSATGELVRRFGGYPVPVLLNFDHNVMADRVCIDPEIWSDALLKYALERPTVNSRELVLQKYTWSHIINKVITAIDEAPNPKWSWTSPLKQYGLPPLKGDMTATQFVHLLSSHIPHLKWSGFNLLNLRALNTQLDLRGKQLMSVTPENIAQRYKEIIDRINYWERVRVGKEPQQKEDYLYATS